MLAAALWTAHAAIARAPRRAAAYIIHEAEIDIAHTTKGGNSGAKGRPLPVW